MHTFVKDLKESIEKSGNFEKKQQWLINEEKRLKQVILS